MLDRRGFLQGTAGALAVLPATPSQALAANGVPSGPSPITAPAAAVAATSTAPRYDVTAAVNPDLKAHGGIFARKIHKIGDNVYSAVGWSACNTVMVVGDDGVIIVDTGADLQSAQEVAREFRKITDKPVRAIVYTCFHLDHISGVKGHVSAEDVKAGRVQIVAHETLLANVIRQGRTIGPILGIRTAYNFGAILAGADIDGMNNGTGPLVPPGGKVSFIAPTRTFATTLDMTIAGVAMNFVHVPSEAADEIAIFLPESRILLSSEVVPAQHFPALHALRGEAFRDPVAWYRSIDTLRRFNTAALVPAHGQASDRRGKRRGGPAQLSRRHSVCP